MKAAVNTRSIGAAAEEKVCRWLEEKGYVIRDRNFAVKTGEIDIIASTGNILCFIEVKSASGNFIPPEMKVNRKKQKKILNTARVYMSGGAGGGFDSYRFDVASVTGEKIEYYEDAFRS